MVRAACTLPRHVNVTCTGHFDRYCPYQNNTEVLLRKHLKDIFQWMMTGRAGAHFQQLLAACKELLALPAFIEYLCQ